MILKKVKLYIGLSLVLLWVLWVQYQMGFPHSSVGKESACNSGDPRSIPGSERSTGEGIGYPLQYSWASFVAQLIKNLPAIRETWVWSLGWEDPLEKGLPTPVFWPGEFHGLYNPQGPKESDTTEWLSLSSVTDFILNFILKMFQDSKVKWLKVLFLLKWLNTVVSRTQS